MSVTKLGVKLTAPAETVAEGNELPLVKSEGVSVCVPLLLTVNLIRLIMRVLRIDKGYGANYVVQRPITLDNKNPSNLNQI